MVCISASNNVLTPTVALVLLYLVAEVRSNILRVFLLSAFIFVSPSFYNLYHGSGKGADTRGNPTQVPKYILTHLIVPFNIRI